MMLRTPHEAAVVMTGERFRVGFLPGRKAFLPFPWEEMGFFMEETGKKLPNNTVT